MSDALVGLLGLTAVIAVVVGLWRWAHRDDEVWYEDSSCGEGYYYEEYEEEWYEEER